MAGLLAQARFIIGALALVIAVVVAAPASAQQTQTPTQLNPTASSVKEDQLLRELNTVDSIRWIRFLYAYPNLVSDELLDTIAECDKVVKYLDCPLQHMHPEVLRKMRRPVMDHVAFAQRVRERIPGVRLRTGLIVGFPGETEEHFQFLKESGIEPGLP